MNSMITPTAASLHGALSATLLLFASAAVPALAQTANPATPANSDTKTDVVVLSPFEVGSQKDTGFVAASAVAGGRLAIDLKDSPASYSVLNKEFLDALQITGLEQAADWAPNSTRVPDNGNESTFGGAVLVAIRGVPGFFAQRDFFPMEFNFDSYNLDRFDYGRGPNAVLFGFAAFSGTQNVVSKVARTDSTFGETRLSYGSWDNRRVTADLNYRINPRLALRLNLLWADREGWRELEHEQKHAMHLAGKFQLTKNTEIRAEGEIGKFRENTPYPSGYYDALLGWNGSYIYEQRQATPSNAVALGVTSYGNLTNNVNTFAYVPSLNAASGIDLMGTGRTVAVQAGGTLGGMTVAGAANNFGGATVDELMNAPGNRYDLAIRNSQFRIPGKDHSFGLTSNDFSGREYELASLFITHRIGNLYLEAAGNASHNDRHAYLSAQNGLNASIDINRNLPSGQPNPMFLQPFTQGQMRRLNDSWHKRNLRLSAAYVLENTRFGSYSFQGMGGTYVSHRPYIYEMYAVQRLADKADWAQASELMEYRQYWNSTKDFTPPTTASWTDATGTARTAPAGWIRDIRGSGTSFVDDRELKFVQASIRGRWFDNKLIGIISARQDNLTRTTARSIRSRDLVGTNWNPQRDLFLPFIDRQTWTNLTYIPKAANGAATGPAVLAATRPRDAAGVGLVQYANDKFQDDYSGFPIEAKVKSAFMGAVYHFRPWATFAVNYSQGADFNDAPNRYDGSSFGQKKSSGLDLSFRSELLGGRLNTTLTYYEGKQENEGFTGGGVPWGSFNTVINANKVGDTSENGTNARSFAPLTSAGWDSRSTENKGFEFEAVANLSRSWRLTFNAALPKAVQTDNAKDFRTYFKANETALRAILADAGILIDSLGQASLDPSVPVAQRAPNNEHQNAVTAWNTIYTGFQNLVADAQPLSRLVKFTANVYTDYQFMEGKLKGLRVGGGFNYRGKQVLGYRASDTIANPANPTVAIDDPSVGPYNTVETDPYYTAVMNLSYTWKKSDKLSFRFDLKVDNLLDWDKPIYTSTRLLPPGGNLATPARTNTPSVYYMMTPRSYMLSMTTKF